MAQNSLNLAIDELRQSAGDIGKLHSVGPVLILVYAAVYELKQNFPLEGALKVFQEAWDKLTQAGA